MDLQAAETAHKRDQKDQVSSTKKAWNCPCNGCGKAVKQERERILNALDKIDIDSPYQLNVVGMKILIQEIVRGENA